MDLIFCPISTAPPSVSRPDPQSLVGKSNSHSITEFFEIISRHDYNLRSLDKAATPHAYGLSPDLIGP